MNFLCVDICFHLKGLEALLRDKWQLFLLPKYSARSSKMIIWTSELKLWVGDQEDVEGNARCSCEQYGFRGNFWQRDFPFNNAFISSISTFPKDPKQNSYKGTGSDSQEIPLMLASVWAGISSCLLWLTAHRGNAYSCWLSSVTWVRSHRRSSLPPVWEKVAWAGLGCTRHWLSSF